MSTHYIEYFTHRDRWNQQRAACGEYVDAKRHSNEPTCPECVTYVTRRAALDQEIDATFSDMDPRR